MRKRILISLMVALSLTACVKDQYIPESCTEEEEGKKYYLSFVLNSTSGPLRQENTKGTIPATGEFSARTIAEQLVSRIDMYFYTSSGEYLGKVFRIDFRQTPQGEGEPVSNIVGKYVVELPYKPARMLITANFPSSSMDLTDCSLAEARNKVQESEMYGLDTGVDVTYKNGSSDVKVNVKPFYMTSSTYIDGAKEICDIEIDPDHIYRSESAAMAGTHHDVYLERLAAKITLKAPKKEFMVPIVTSQDSVVAKVTLEGWNVNAINRNSYYFKKVNPSWTYEWQSGIYWNNRDKHRSYWATDKNYESGDHGVINLAQQTNPLLGDKFLYRKPADLNLTLEETTDGSFIGSTYCLENTMDGLALPVTDEATTLYSRATHILIKAKLSFALGKYDSDPDYVDDDEFKGAQDFFRYKGMFFTKKGLLNALRRDTDLDPNIPLDELSLDSAKDQSYCAGYDKGERVAVKNGSTFLDLKDNNGNRIRIDGFKDGYFYYKIPIEHINNEDFTGTTYPIAKYGVVRNHSYEITLAEDLKGIGTGIWDDSFDIRPFRKTDDYRVTAYVRVSPWMQFETRFLFIDPSGLLVTDGQRVDRWEDGDNPHGNDWTGDGWYF
ncbi:MAG: Mfa1 family fimbria major subunit [Bacteroidales bacterium]|nr:Mfa1 family fimbria major subunit [Bacteroidales bacterium]